jgi:hypothetical protein
MFRRQIYTRNGKTRAILRAVVPASEQLESRSLLSSSVATMGLATTRIHPGAANDQLEMRRVDGVKAIGTISGRVTSSTTGRGLGRV